MMLEEGATHVGVATDHVVESFRNDLYDGYKTSEGMDPELLTQFPCWRARSGRSAWRCSPWSTSKRTTPSPRRRGWPVATPRRPGPDLHPRQGPRAVRARPARRPGRPSAGGQGVRRGRRARALRRGSRVDPRPTSRWWVTAPTGSRASRAGVRSRRPPCSPATRRSMPSPTTRRSGRSPCAVPRSSPPRSRARDEAALYLELARLRDDADVGTVDDWEWRGPAPQLRAWAERLGSATLLERAQRLARQRFG